MLKAHSSLRLRSSKSGGKHLNMKKQIVVIVVAIFIGCIPVSIILIIALLIPSDTLFSWAAVFVMPTNAVLNPIVYTLKTAACRRNKKEAI